MGQEGAPRLQVGSTKDPPTEPQPPNPSEKPPRTPSLNSTLHIPQPTSPKSQVLQRIPQRDDPLTYSTPTPQDYTPLSLYAPM